MKKKLLMVAMLCMTMFIGGCTFNDEEEVVLTDGQKFKDEYPVIDEDNMFKYVNIDETISILENGTGVIYIGFPECQWCQAYISMLYGAAKDVGITEVSYLNIQEDRSNNSDEYLEVVSLLEEHLDYGSDGNKRVYVPAVVAVVDGEIVGFDQETAPGVEDNMSPDEYWTSERVDALVLKLTNMITLVNDEVCMTCDI